MNSVDLREFGVLAVPVELDRAHLAMTVLLHQKFGNARLFAFFIPIIIIAVNKEHHIGVLLDRAGFTQVCQTRTALIIAALFRSARKLRQTQHRNIQLFRHDFQRTRDLADLLHAVF